MRCVPRKAQVLAIVVVALFVGPLLGLSAAGNDVVVVTPETLVAADSPTGWYFWDDTNDEPGGPGALVDGPGTPPLGTGSVRLGPLTAASGNDSRSAIATNAYYRELLSAFGALSYWTYTPTGANAITLQFDVSTVASAGAWCGRIIFEPANGNGAVVNDTWQEWDALAGKWWSTKNPATCGSWNTGAGSIADPQPWSWVLANFKQVEGRTLLKSGAGWLDFNGNADALTITTTNTTYDFELVAPSPPAPAPPAPPPVAIQPRFTG